MVQYIRDGRAPLPRNELISRVMSANRAKNTGPERILKKHLTLIGLKGFTSHYKGVPGRPDICYKENKLAIFVNGCYWHRCPYCKPSMPKTHRGFWINKFKNNKERDRRRRSELKGHDWRSVTLWECQIIKHPDRCIERIKKNIYGKE